MVALPRITFGMIVLNGEPFLLPNLRAIYPFAHEIIVVEGASPRATHMATPDGHSIDGTLAALRRFQAEEDPAGKLVVVTAEDDGHPDGFWPGEKDQQSQAYARRATGEWLWQIDCDEFYQPETMAAIAAALAAHRELTCVTFRAHHFWGGFDYLVEGGLFLSREFQGEPWGAYRRIFRWGPGYSYLGHRPPRVADERGVDITRRRMRDAAALVPGAPARMYHYLMVFPAQFTRKGAYYARQPWEWDRGRLEKNEELLREVDLANGFAIYDQHGTRNWLARFRGAHPPAVAELRAAAAASGMPTRRTDDIEALLADPPYRWRRRVFALAEWARFARDELSFHVWSRPRMAAGRVLRAVLPASAQERLWGRLRTWRAARQG
jgi:hypothetical protein